MQPGSNGQVITKAKEIPAQSKPAERVELTAAQKKHIVALATQIALAQQAHDAAKKALDVVQANADAFILYCAEEKGVVLGSDGWGFAQAELSFVRFVDATNRSE